MIHRVLSGDRGPPRHIVIANAAAALWTVGKSESLKICAETAAAVVDSGAANSLLERLVALTNASG
jgi:anthranilate phosphoribosyltransferase